MTLQILSDLHLEFEDTWPAGDLKSIDLWSRISAVPSDIVVLAGDIATKGRGAQFAQAMFPGREVVMVAGNHEYYGQSYRHHLAKLKDAAGTQAGVHFLEREATVIGGTVFLGCTLWTDCKLWEAGLQGAPFSYPVTLMELEEGMTDYRRIKFFDGRGYRRFKPTDTIREHQASVRWLRDQLELYRGAPMVVVTHHAPSMRSLGAEAQTEVLSAAYASHLDELVEASGASLWIHGHIHSPADYRIGRTRVIANPKGYPGQNTSFRPDLTVEL